MGVAFRSTVIISQFFRPFSQQCLKVIWRKSVKNKLKSRMSSRASILPSFWGRFHPSSDAFQIVKFTLLIAIYSIWFLASNVLAICELANRFQVDTLLSKCERILRNCFEIPLSERFFFAEKHSLKGLMVIFLHITFLLTSCIEPVTCHRSFFLIKLKIYESENFWAKF